MPPKKKAAPKKDRRIALVITEAELAALDAWRARNHVWSRSAARMLGQWPRDRQTQGLGRPQTSRRSDSSAAQGTTPTRTAQSDAPAD